MDTKLTDRGLLRAVLAAFALFWAYRFLAAVVATALLLATGLLFTVALSAPVEALHRRKVPRPVSVALIVLGAAVLLGVSWYLLFQVLTKQATQLASALPAALLQLVERAREQIRSLDVKIGGGEGISPSTVARIGRKLVGGALGDFTSLISLLTAFIVVLFVPLSTWWRCLGRSLGRCLGSSSQRTETQRAADRTQPERASSVGLVAD